MKVITGNRGSGKTTRIVQEANLLAQQGYNVVILTGIPGFEDILKNYGLDPKIIVNTYHQYRRNSIGNRQYRNAKILIDEADSLLREVLGNDINSITVSADTFDIIGDR